MATSLKSKPKSKPTTKPKSKPKSKSTWDKITTFFKSLFWIKDLKFDTDHTFQITSVVWVGIYVLTIAYLLANKFENKIMDHKTYIWGFIIVILFLYIWPAILETEDYTDKKTNPKLYWGSIIIYVVTMVILIAISWIAIRGKILWWEKIWVEEPSIWTKSQQQQT